MSIHPLFSGFKWFSPHQVGAALGFAIHVETAHGRLPLTLPAEYELRMMQGGELADFHYAGGWQASGVHCLLFAKPLTALAAEWWRAGVNFTNLAVAN